jgi:FeS assembly SUF system protein
MSDPKQQPEKVPLPVLPNSGKVEQLKGEPRLAPNPATPAYAGHTNRIAPNIPPHLKPLEQRLLEGKVIAALRTIYDPEIPVDIYELGLIYDIEIDPENKVHIRMTLTAPACPVAGTLPGEVEKKVENIPEVKSAAVELVWDPPWSKDMMSEAAMLQLGLC